jgi:mono/diheme cytochrome c family protein
MLWFLPFALLYCVWSLYGIPYLRGIPVDFIGLGALIVLTVLFAFLAFRAFRAQRAWVRLAGGIAATLFALLFGAGTVLALVGYNKLATVRANPVPQLNVQFTPQLVAEGERFAQTCAGCHSSNNQLPLTGKDFLGSEGGPPLGRLWAPNLTPAHLASWSDGEIVRAIREGIGRDGRSLLIMPSAAFRNLSDEDVLALVAYLRSQPAVEPQSPPRSISALGAIMLATVLPDSFLSAQPSLTTAVVAPTRGPTAEYGSYLVETLGCQECHGQNLAGGAEGGAGPAPGQNLTTLPERLDAVQFTTLLRTGTYPDGSKLSPEMPYQDLGKLSDEDFLALHTYFASLQPLPDN